MARKSNKTAHVLNLLAGGQVDNEQAEHQEPELKKKAPSNISLIDPASISDPLSSLIRDTLDKEVIQSDNNADNSGNEKDGNNTREAVNRPEIAETAPAPPLPNDPSENSDQQMSNLLHDDTLEEITTDSTNFQDAIVDESSTAPVIPDILSEKANDQTSDLVSSVVSPEVEDKLTEIIQNQLNTETPAVIDEPLPVTEKTETESLEAAGLEAAEASKKAEEIVFSPGAADQADDNNFHVAAETAEKEPAPIPLWRDKDAKPEEAVIPAISAPPTSDTNEAPTMVDISPDTIIPEEAEPELEYKYVNMMDIIVEERLLEFMNRFNVCTCKRCVADTKALALNNLPPKYIVAPVASFSPLLSFYRNKFNIYVITELTKACLVVLDQPRH